jgi:hypothetical protein
LKRGDVVLISRAVAIARARANAAFLVSERSGEYSGRLATGAFAVCPVERDAAREADAGREAAVFAPVERFTVRDAEAFLEAADCLEAVDCAKLLGAVAELMSPTSAKVPIQRIGFLLTT